MILQTSLSFVESVYPKFGLILQGTVFCETFSGRESYENNEGSLENHITYFNDICETLLFGDFATK